MSDSLPPHGLHSPWSFPGQNTGVGSLSLLQGIFPTQRSPALQVDSLPAESQEKPKNTGVGSLSLPQRIFLIQETSRSSRIQEFPIQESPALQRILYKLNHKGSPRILEWVAYPFSRGTPHPRNWTGVSCIAGRFFANWAMAEICCLWTYL